MNLDRNNQTRTDFFNWNSLATSVFIKSGLHTNAPNTISICLPENSLEFSEIIGH